MARRPTDRPAPAAPSRGRRPRSAAERDVADALLPRGGAPPRRHRGDASPPRPAAPSGSPADGARRTDAQLAARRSRRDASPTLIRVRARPGAAPPGPGRGAGPPARETAPSTPPPPSPARSALTIAAGSGSRRRRDRARRRHGRPCRSLIALSSRRPRFVPRIGRDFGVGGSPCSIRNQRRGRSARRAGGRGGRRARPRMACVARPRRGAGGARGRRPAPPPA